MRIFSCDAGGNALFLENDTCTAKRCGNSSYPFALTDRDVDKLAFVRRVSLDAARAP